MTDHEKKAQEIINWTVSEGTRDFSALHAAIVSALREAEAGERERCVDYLMGQAMTLADRANSGTPVKVELLAAAGLVEDLANDFRAAAIRSRNDE